MTKVRHTRLSHVSLLLCFLFLFLVTATGCAELEPQWRIDVESDGSGYVSLETRSRGDLADLPVRVALGLLQEHLAAAGIRGEVTRFPRAGKDRWAVRARFQTPDELQRMLSTPVRLPAEIRRGLPPQVDALVPERLSLADVTLSLEAGALGRKTYTFRAALDPALVTVLEAGGLSVRVALPGSVATAATNGRVAEGDVVWPGPQGWPTSLAAQSQVGVFGMGWGWVGPALLAAALVAGIGGAGWLFVGRQRTPSWDEADPSGSDADQGY